MCACGSQVWKPQWCPQMLHKNFLKLCSWSSADFLWLLVLVYLSWSVCLLISMFFILLKQGLKVQNFARFPSIRLCTDTGDLWGPSTLPSTLLQKCTFPFPDCGSCCSHETPGACRRAAMLCFTTHPWGRKLKKQPKVTRKRMQGSILCKFSPKDHG